MKRFKIVDKDPDLTWHRETVVEAADREAAQEIYIDDCEANGVVHGYLSISRVF